MLGLVQYSICGKAHDQKLRMCVYAAEAVVLRDVTASLIPERAEGFVVVVVGRRQAGDHQGLGVAAQRVLEHARQLRVSVGYMLRFAINQCRNDVAKGR